jgi:hypothetical protein
LDEHENNAGEEADQIYEEFYKTASKFSSSFLTINLKRNDSEAIVSLRKSLIRLIKAIIQFGFQVFHFTLEIRRFFLVTFRKGYRKEYGFYRNS